MGRQLLSREAEWINHVAPHNCPAINNGNSPPLPPQQTQLLKRLQEEACFITTWIIKHLALILNVRAQYEHAGPPVHEELWRDNRPSKWGIVKHKHKNIYWNSKHIVVPLHLQWLQTFIKCCFRIYIVWFDLGFPADLVKNEMRFHHQSIDVTLVAVHWWLLIIISPFMCPKSLQQRQGL